MKRAADFRCLGLGAAALVAVLAVAAAVPARAGDPPGWRLRVDFAVVDPSDDRWQSTVGGGAALAEFDTGAGFGVRGEYQFSPRMGIDFGFLTTASVDVETTSSGTASVDFETFAPFFVGVDFHLTPDRRVDLYLGPQLAWVQYDDVSLVSSPGSSGVEVSIDNDLGLGAILGLDVPLGEKRHWAFQTSLRYLTTSMEGNTATQRVDVDFDPVILSVGFGYRW